MSTKTSALGWIADMGAAGQALVPGAYAWAITVAPVAWSRGANEGAQAGAVLALAALASTVLRGKGGSTAIGTWVFVLASTVVWVAVPSALTPAHLHPARGMAGMLGWGAFAFAAAAPALTAPEGAPQRVNVEGGLKPRVALSRGDAIYLALGVVLAAALQCVGWSASTPERAVFVRLITIVSGIAVVGVATTLTTARHDSSERTSFSRALRRSALTLVAFFLLAAVGVVHALGAR